MNCNIHFFKEYQLIEIISQYRIRLQKMTVVLSAYCFYLPYIQPSLRLAVNNSWCFGWSLKLYLCRNFSRLPTTSPCPHFLRSSSAALVMLDTSLTLRFWPHRSHPKSESGLNGFRGKMTPEQLFKVHNSEPMCKPHSAGSRHLLQLQSKCHFLAIIGLLVRVGKVSVRY